MKSVRGRRPSNEGNEPGIEPDVGWVEAGGELILAAGFTEAGFPYGFSVDEYRDANFRADSGAGSRLIRDRESERGRRQFVGEHVAKDTQRLSRPRRTRFGFLGRKNGERLASRQAIVAGEAPWMFSMKASRSNSMERDQLCGLRSLEGD